MKDVTLYYIHDPMCSWCWGFRPTWQDLQARLPDGVRVEYLVGGLAPDSDEPMPEEMRRYLQQAWHKIHDTLGAEFNFDFWEKCQPRRSTYPACRAVLAAEGQAAGKAMIEAIQRAYYTRAMNPSDKDTLVQLAAELGLDSERFGADLESAQIQQALLEQIDRARSLSSDGFPSLVLEIDGTCRPIGLNYRDADAMLEQIRTLIAAD